MKKVTINQEILLHPGSRFFERDWCELKNDTGAKKLSKKERLIQLCWNGMLKEIIPEICKAEPGKKPPVLWEISESEHLLYLKYGDFDQSMDNEWSLNPYVSLAFERMN